MRIVRHGNGLTGWDREQFQIRQLVDLPVTSQVLIVLGEAGVGKTALLDVTT